MQTTTLRIIAGSLRSRKIQFAIDPRTRPMKDRTREAIMSLLGGTFENAIVFDLFGGTGVLAFETISRGASQGVVFEILKPAAREIQLNAKNLGVASELEVIQTDVLDWSEGLPENAKRFEKNDAIWVVHCCPPYALWESEGTRLRDMLQAWWDASPAGSLFAVELEESTPTEFLPTTPEWDLRLYRPARMAVAEKPRAERSVEDS